MQEEALLGKGRSEENRKGDKERWVEE